MLKLNKKIEYALIAIRYMADRPAEKLTSAKEISDITRSPFDATSRALQVMTSHGILKSVQGVRGGYQLVKDLKEISFLELAEMILGPFGVVKCIHSKEDSCELSEICPISSPMGFLNDRVKDLFSKISLQEMFTAGAERFFDSEQEPQTEQPVEL
jgi:Rrf2 family nitric oxide-sensitive transcriptional repressor